MLQTGSLIGNYQIEALLGQGGMGVVYEAIQLSLSRRVALKVITPELSRNDRFQERFRREGRSQAALDHPNVVTVHDFGEADGQLYISMQLDQRPEPEGPDRTAGSWTSAASCGSCGRSPTRSTPRTRTG